ncbi:HdeD family acid-resistance protein [Elizabethkingia anophelis]|uniref:HdeD family acid-resistance protein n=1 Tax=Elizabethkingia anophelis TaxID=1117645 RepID=UPI0009D2A9DF|nr:DUF308 domain-containing protein [Elizabethkingia anophelis]OPB99409.1 hypothetical protein BAS08_11260 [Elizabethkingia anophelis]
MPSSFSTTIKMPLKGWFLPLISGIFSVITGLYIFFINSDAYLLLNIFPGAALVISGLVRLFFALLNRKAINGWGWHLIYGMLILDMGIYLFIYTGVSIVFYIGFTSFLRSVILLGTAIDLKRHEHKNWKRIAIGSLAGVIFSIILLAEPLSFKDTSRPVLTGIFIATGISVGFLALEFKKINSFYKKLKKLTLK